MARVGKAELTVPTIRNGPVNSFKQFLRRDRHRTGQLDERVDADYSPAMLDQSDLGAMQRCSGGKLFLR